MASRCPSVPCCARAVTIATAQCRVPETLAWSEPLSHETAAHTGSDVAGPCHHGCTQPLWRQGRQLLLAPHSHRSTSLLVGCLITSMVPGRPLLQLRHLPGVGVRPRPPPPNLVQRLVRRCRPPHPHQHRRCRGGAASVALQSKQSWHTPPWCFHAAPWHICGTGAAPHAAHLLPCQPMPHPKHHVAQQAPHSRACSTPGHVARGTAAPAPTPLPPGSLPAAGRASPMWAQPCTRRRKPAACAGQARARHCRLEHGQLAPAAAISFAFCLTGNAPPCRQPCGPLTDPKARPRPVCAPPARPPGLPLHSPGHSARL